MMDMLKAFLAGMLDKGKSLLFWVLRLPKKLMCMLHSKICGC